MTGTDVVVLPERRTVPTTDFRTFRRIGGFAAASTGAVRMVAFILAAVFSGRRIEVGHFFDLIPYPVVVTDRIHFATLVSRSTLYATVILTVVFIVMALRNPRPSQQLAGWAVGVGCSAEMLVIDVVRHLLHPPTVVWRLVTWTTWIVVVGTVVLVICARRPGRSDESDASLTHQASLCVGETPKGTGPASSEQ